MSSAELTTQSQEVLHHVQIVNPEGKETILLVHGMFGNLAQFYLTLAPFLSEHYRVVMYDLKCHGKSMRYDGGFDLTTLSHDLLSIMDDLRIQSSHLLGFSYGALIVLKFTSLFADRVGKVIAIEVPPRHTYELKKRGQYSFADFEWFASTLAPDIRANFLRSKRQVQNHYKMYEFIYNETTYVDDVETEKEFDEHFYSTLSVPVQLFFGDNSICLPELNRIKGWMSDVVISMGRGDHGFFMHRPKETAAMIDQFLKGTLKPAVT